MELLKTIIFGRWTVIRDLGFVKSKYSNRRKVVVKCDCGNEREHFYDVLKSGRSTSCGCYRVERQRTSAKKIKHGLSNHPLFQIWRGMKTRCYNKSDKAYHRYGGRGITVCDEWVNDFKSFYDWAIENGWAEGLINDRRDNDKGYSPSNCRFVTDAVSMRNTRRNFNIEYNGVTKCVTDWAADIGITPQSFRKRLRSGWGISRTISTPKKNIVCQN